MCKFAKKQKGLLKFLKSLEKKRRRKLTRSSKKSKKARSKRNDDSSDSEKEDDRMTAASQARTVCADSIFKLMEESDEAPSDEVNSFVKWEYVNILTLGR